MLTKEEVVERAEEWARLHGQREFQQMDECLAGLSKDDERRVYLCGQRMAGGLKLRVIPPVERKEIDERKINRDEPSNKANQGKVPVGASGRAQGSDKKRRNPKQSKQ